jgi:hypothetical protein
MEEQGVKKELRAKALNLKGLAAYHDHSLVYPGIRSCFLLFYKMCIYQ